MNGKALLLAFPLVPVFTFLVVLTSKYLLRRDISRTAVLVNAVLQTAAGILLMTLTAGGNERLAAEVSQWRHSIVFFFDRPKVFFLTAYLVPLVLSATVPDRIGSGTHRSVFLLFAAGSSVLVVTGDMFTFFVGYELMIMAAYILVSAKGHFYASVTYMLTGAVSSSFLLAGVIVLYGSGHPLALPSGTSLAGLAETNVEIAVLFFMLAFFVKSGQFPVSYWLPSCHSASPAPVSAFLSSFTAFAGIVGFHYFVFTPAESMGIAPVFLLTRIAALLSIGVSSLFLFFETDLKRCIAQSTVYSSGIVLLFLSHGDLLPALIYITAHAAYKSLLFLVSDEVERNELTLRGGWFRFSLLLLLVTFFGAGLVPGLTYFIKESAHGLPFGEKILLYASFVPFLGGFYKFRFLRDRSAVPGAGFIPLLLTAAAVFAALYLFLPLSYRLPALYELPLYTGLIIAAAAAGRILYPRVAALSNPDSRFLYRNLNVDLLLVLALFACTAAILRLLPA